MSASERKLKPFALALIVDVVEDRKAVDTLLSRIDVELAARKAKPFAAARLVFFALALACVEQ